MPGDPDNPSGTHIRFDSNDGVFAAVEFGYLATSEEGQAPNKLAIGIWLHTTETTNIAGETEDQNLGAYLIGESALTETIVGFVQLGATDPSINRIAWYLGAGATVTGWIPGRPEDKLGLAVGAAINSDDFLDANTGYDRHETVIECSWEAALTETLTLQPDLQYIINPGDSPGTENAFQLGVRATLSY